MNTSRDHELPEGRMGGDDALLAALDADRNPERELFWRVVSCEQHIAAGDAPEQLTEFDRATQITPADLESLGPEKLERRVAWRVSPRVN